MARSSRLARSVGLALVAVVLATACGPSAAQREEALQSRPPFTPPSFPTVSPSATLEVTETPPVPSPPIRPSPLKEPPPSCPSTALLGVYSPERLHVVARCTWFVGYVVRIVRLSDGDVRFDLAPASGYGHWLNDANRSAQQSQFPAVMIYGQPMVYIMPNIGERISVFGTLVRERDGGWNEMHPVWEVRYPGTTIYAIPPVPPLHQSG